MKKKTTYYNNLLAGAEPSEIINFFSKKLNKKLSFATSLGAEDQAITAMIAELQVPVRIFTLDTGRLFQETYDLLDITKKKYDLNIHIMFPESIDVEEMVSSKGINLFYDSVGNRKLCCQIRKVSPMRRALYGTSGWITGMRKEQNGTRKKINIIEWDDKFKKIKINPLANWTSEQVWDYIRKNKVPYNTLHDKGFPSIGCQPCTRAVLPGENERSGRWWWETAGNRECGLHAR